MEYTCRLDAYTLQLSMHIPTQNVCSEYKQCTIRMSSTKKTCQLLNDSVTVFPFPLNINVKIFPAHIPQLDLYSIVRY
jgi:hypothetical protein